jgi:hypothetical protein
MLITRWGFCEVAKSSQKYTYMPPFVILQVDHIWIYAFFVEFLFHHFIALYGGLYMQLTIPSRSTFLPRLSSVQMWLQSLNGVIKNCVGAVDGYLLSIETPSKHYAKNVRS